MVLGHHVDARMCGWRAGSVDIPKGRGWPGKRNKPRFQVLGHHIDVCATGVSPSKNRSISSPIPTTFLNIYNLL